MADMCDDNRFEVIEKYKQKLIESTNIESSPDEMATLDNILFRCWQMGWLDKWKQIERKKGKWFSKNLDNYRKYEVVCSECGTRYVGNYDAYDEPCDFNFCPSCGAKMEEFIDEP